MKSVGTTGQVSIKLFGAHFASCKREEQMFDACDFRFTSVTSDSQFSISFRPVGHLRITFLELHFWGLHFWNSRWSTPFTHFFEKHLLVESIITNDIIDKFFRGILSKCFMANLSTHWYRNHNTEKDKHDLTENHWFESWIELWTRLTVLKINRTFYFAYLIFSAKSIFYRESRLIS